MHSDADMNESVYFKEEDLSSRELTAFPLDVLQNKHIESLLLDYNDIKELPPEIGMCIQSLKCFSALGNSLTSIPESFGNLGQLEEVYLNENELVKLPDSLCRLKHLKVLKLTGNQLKVLPEEFGELTALEKLSCDENILFRLPKTFGCLENLRILELSCNSIEKLSEGFGMLRSLEVLNLCSNKLTSLPESFGNLPNLKTVDISVNEIKFLPSHFNSSLTLQKIYIDSNLLQTLPDWVSNLENIVEFSVKDNQFQNQTLSDSFPKVCKKLKHLDLSGNFMSYLPSTIGELEKLEFLHLGSVIGELERRNFQNGNWLAEIPNSICCLTNLKQLHLDENQLNELPRDFGSLISLEILDLGQNLLHELPESFGNLKCLRVCMLSKNHLMWLPSNFGDLSELEDLRLDDNELAELPESFYKLSKLKTLDLFSNRLIEIPVALHQLKNLVRLDLDCNDFKVPLSQIPQIITQSKYPERDPNLKDNWRGRARKDITNLDKDIIKAPNYGPLEDFEPPPPGLNLSEDCLIMAMKKNMSIWKSHSDTSNAQRKPYRPKQRMRIHYDSGSEDDNEDNEKLVHNLDIDNECEGSYEDSGTDYDNPDDDEDDDDDNFEPPIYIQPTEWSGLKQSVPDKGTQENVQAMLEDTECWDDEVNENAKQFDETPVYVHPTKLYYTPIDCGKFTFAPFDIHEESYVKRPERYPVEDGQFENCDIDDTEDINVDPVF
ncbi:leucine-rich repeat protein soc-2 homolog [Ruditapes philippinarum]|uniref:leucine-rich repeat protein soc-2 homolog n=1 Tax=Ruditapes philippinarum TaxID=129788 RepID=UPI00295B6F86|nr:leucine-rich repeat protein soc-2 homolog [Ruditapes philippinarum]XP_060556180.1 leucine-rich repeat protein soc-2 homolog [Ruditapes philippinarum]